MCGNFAKISTASIPAFALKEVAGVEVVDLSLLLPMPGYLELTIKWLIVATKLLAWTTRVVLRRWLSSRLKGSRRIPFMGSEILRRGWKLIANNLRFWGFLGSNLAILLAFAREAPCGESGELTLHVYLCKDASSDNGLVSYSKAVELGAFRLWQARKRIIPLVVRGVNETIGSWSPCQFPRRDPERTL
ncbi:hypothetical protein Patl1_36817 [Pistacia atlantica]|nr:hypothetical protein Patl1_36817 [Pistacia atlantica]